MAAQCAAVGMVCAALIRLSQNNGPGIGGPFVSAISAFGAAMLRIAHLAGMYTRA
jgi:hypothetical protein